MEMNNEIRRHLIGIANSGMALCSAILKAVGQETSTDPIRRGRPMKKGSPTATKTERRTVLEWVDFNSARASRLARLTDGVAERWINDLGIKPGPGRPGPTKTVRLLQKTRVEDFAKLETRKLQAMAHDIGVQFRKGATRLEMAAAIRREL